jgi:LysM repeat protein
VRIGCATYLIVALSFVAGGMSWLAYQKKIMPGVRYVAVRGDSIESVAASNALSADALRAWNWGVDDPIEPNQVLMIWPRGRPFVEDIADAVHIVQRRWAPQMLVVPLKATLATVRWRADGVQVGKDEAIPLAAPPAQSCLARRVIEPIRPGDPERVRAGLTNEQINAAMEAFLPRATKCLDGARNPGTMRLDMVVACDGRVARVQQIGDSGYPAPIVECITNVLHYVPFPAHDAEEGDHFEYLLDLKPDPM